MTPVFSCSLSVVALAWLGVLQDPGESAITFERDQKENVVASRRLGTWEVDAGLTRRLRGHQETRDLTFTLDWSLFPDSVFKRLSQELVKQDMRLTVYAMGLAKGLLKDQEVPFFLTTMDGTPRVYWFRPENGDPFGNGESFNVMLARGRERGNDLLFRGGDFNNQPFTAYKRKD